MITNRIWKRICVLSLIYIIFMFIIYTKFYYGEICIESVMKHFIICSNIAIGFIIHILKLLLNSFLTEGNIKNLIILSALIYIVSKVDIKELFNSINKFEIGDLLKIERNIEKLKELNKVENENYEKLQSSSQPEQDDEMEKKVKISKQRMEIIRILISEPFVLNLLIRFIENKIKGKRIPINLFKESTSFESIGVIFDYETSHDSVKIKGIKKDVKDIVMDIYVKELRENL